MMRINSSKLSIYRNIITITLLLFYVSLYFVPYFREVFGLPSWVAVREMLLGSLLIIMLYKCKTPKVPLWFFLYTILLLCSFIVSEYHGAALSTVIILIRFIFLYVFTATFIKTEHQKIFFCRFFYLMGFIALAMILLQVVVGPIPVINMYSAFDEASMRFGLFRYSTVFGNTITSAMLLLIFLFQVIELHRKNTFKVVFIVLIVFGILMTVSKAPIAILAIYLAYILIKKFFEMSFGYKIITSFICFSVLFILTNHFYHEIEETVYTVQLIDNINTSDQLESDVQARVLEKPQKIFNMMMDRGFLSVIIGGGFDIAGQAADEVGGIKPHNAIIEIFANLGVFGVCLYGYIFYSILRFSISIKPTTLANKHLKGLASGVVIALVSALFVDPHITNVLMVPVFFLLAVADSHARPHFQKIESRMVYSH